jgi:polynucleotide 5'-hydroxyl-kinase GRC3/NOL9
MGMDGFEVGYAAPFLSHRVQAILTFVYLSTFNLGLGYDLLMGTLKAVHPTHVCQMVPTANAPPRRFSAFEVPRGPWADISIPAPLDDPTTLQSTARWNSPSHRTLSFLSQLYARGPDRWAFPQAESDKGLTEVRPWVVPWSVLEIWVTGVDLPPSQILWALNASIVGLMVRVGTNTGPEGGSPKGTDLRYIRGREAPASTEEWTCVGIGLVRAIDPVARTFHIIAPSVDAETMRRVGGIVRGVVETPVWCFGTVRQTRGGCMDPEGRVPPYVTLKAQEGIGASWRRVRRNIVRKRLEHGGGA